MYFSLVILVLEYFILILEVLIMADEIIRNVQYPHAQWLFLKETQGYTDLQSKISSGTVSLEGFKIMVIITGRAEVVAQHEAVVNCVQSTIDTIHKANSQLIILLCAPVPYPRDGHIMLEELSEFSAVLNDLCKQSEYLEYSRLGHVFYSRRRIVEPEVWEEDTLCVVKRNLLDRGGLTLQGARLINSRLVDKIASAKLYERYELLSLRLITI